MNRKFAITAGALSIFFVFGLIGCDGNNGGGPLGGTENWSGKSEWMKVGSVKPTSALVIPTEDQNHGNMTVHDPSVYYDDVTNAYYAFGTHFSVAKSTDLIKWSQLSGEMNAGFLYGQTPWKTVLKDTLTELNNESTDSTWAPDVLRIDDTYYMYYSLTNKFGSREAVIGRVSSKNITGPYSNNELIVSSMGGSGAAPNCIDPELFYDKEGRLWMCYGSFAGGIYVKELNATGEKAGLPIEGEDGLHDYGTMVWKNGYRAGVEGPFVYYNAELDYYYMMVSEDMLATTYNMRVARSKNPDGPYVDITGNDVSMANGKGVKMAGNFKFEGESTSYSALGHNSVIKTADGKYLCVYHTRYTPNSGHNMFVSQIYFNEDGWPLVSPTRYIGESMGTVTAERLAGDYDIVLHEVKTEENIVNSVKYTLKADGTIVDAENVGKGSWSLKDGFYVTVTLNDVTYKGVVCTGWRDTGSGANKKSGAILSITATSADGLQPLWAKGVLS